MKTQKRTRVKKNKTITKWEEKEDYLSNTIMWNAEAEKSTCTSADGELGLQLDTWSCRYQVGTRWWC